MQNLKMDVKGSLSVLRSLNIHIVHSHHIRCHGPTICLSITRPYYYL